MSVAIIMAGGFGKRLWPLSSLKHPKQFLILDERESLLQASYRRASQFFGQENTYLAIRRELKEELFSQLPSLSPENLILEPEGRDTAPCIGLASMWIRKRKGDVPMVIFPADHIIGDEERFYKAISVAAQGAKKGFLVTIGIKPTRPETSYGYLKIGDRLKMIDEISFFKVERFTEKPSYKKAKEFFEQGSFLWNAGIFAWKPSTILKEIKKYLPSLYQGLVKIEKALGTEEEEQVIEEVYPLLPKISIDYGVMEKTTKVVSVSGDFFWDDIGSWKALERIFPEDEQGNIIRGLVKEKDTSNCILINREKDKILGTIGVSNLIVINSKRGILIVSKEDVQKVKDLVDELLEKEGLKRYA